MNTKKCYFLIGVPSSGKTTWIKQNADLLDGFRIVSTDDIIEEYALSTGSTYNKVFEDYSKTATKLMNENIDVYTANGENIVWDQTNLTKSSRSRKLSRLNGYDVTAVVFATPTRISARLRRREEETGKHIPLHRVHNMIDTFDYPSIDEGFSEIITVSNIDASVIDRTVNLDNKVIVVDVDGTLANIEHRRHFVSSKPKNWGAFFKGQRHDTPHDDIVYLVNLLKNDGNTIIIASGRTDDTKQQTIDWLNEHNVTFDDIFMRETGDYRSDDIVKQEILEIITEKYGFPYMAIDDRTQVVNMWRKNGIRCLQVAPGDF